MALRLLLPIALLSLLVIPDEVASAAAPADHVPPPPPRPARLHAPIQERRTHHRKHLSRHRRHLHESSREHGAALASRQVRDSREAHRRWLERDEVELIRRSAPSNLPPVCLGTAAAYAQCGGNGFSGDTCCVTGYTCTFANNYYSQCLPSAASPTSTSTSSSAPSPTPSGCTGAQTAYGQCGGSGYTGASCCPSGYFCSYSNPYYSQCVPTTSPSASSTSSSTTSSSSSSGSSSSATSRSTSSSSSSSTSTTTSATPSPTSCSGIQLGYGQCGGIGWSGPMCCVSGWTCTYSNDFYSQCLPSTSSSPTSSTSSSSSSSSSSSTTSSSSTSSSASASSSTAGGCTGSAGAYGQCGGSGYIGGTCCPSGYYCAFANAYYSQCLPGSASSTPTSSSSSSASSSSQTPPASSTSTSTSASATPSAGCSGIQTGYGQCGGTGWSGPTCCPASFVCTYSNAFYSQCLPASGSSTTSSTSSSSSSSSASSTSTKASTSTAASSSSSSAPSPTSTAAAYAQCGGQGFAAQLCPSGFVCAIVNSYYSQCLPSVPSVTYTTATPSAASSSTSSAPSATPTCGTCNIASGGSDGCTPYTVGYSGVTLPQGQTYPSGGHVNYQAIPKSQYVAGQTYLKPGSKWTPQSFGMQFDPNNNQPGGVYIGRNFFDFGQAAAAFPQGYCITWVQLAQYNQHFGEGGQCPICTP
ncbi:putative Cellulose 1,4-beta-cellobiosidase (non-reducing end) [Rhodotorula taiwanensis]|uniref:Putative Cellulose 1,4-beta-cellobiosidase (Non-reducing end) n=1 Tax=Rhodotorula taiwanensis TaxID=741276 RepID=A0A2S5BFF6_9BASI|nr:putative Cellulose 1,4-beta-cellobiosidase (non-reducing end) [Rhodotorula taiwanensis]